MSHDPKRRFQLAPAETTSAGPFNPSLADAPPLPIVDFAAVGKAPPTLLDTPAKAPPKASTVVICWTEAEWAALQQVFCGATAPLAYSSRTKGNWPGWQTWTADLPASAPKGWDHWGSYRLVEVNGAPTLLLKSNTHLDFPGASALEQMVRLLISNVQPTLILSTGTAGGAKPGDHVGTVRATSASTLFEAGTARSGWPIYSNGWTAGKGVLGQPNLAQLLSPVPATAAAIATLAAQFNQHFGTHYGLADLDPLGLNKADPVPAWFDQTGGSASLLTTPTFVVATTAGNLANFTVVEMDDAIIGKACGTTTAFASVRNVSDPAQAAALPAAGQKNWGSAVYDVFGFYTSFNGAVVAWAALN